MVQSNDPKHWTYAAPSKLVPGEDGDVEELWEFLDAKVEGETADIENKTLDVDLSLEDKLMEDNEIDLRVV